MSIETARERLIMFHQSIGQDVLESVKSKQTLEVRGIRLYLMELQGDICVGCGEEFTDSVELCHISASTVTGRGYQILPGNVYAGCKPCNNYDKGKDALAVANSLARPDLIVWNWPTRRELVSLAERYGGTRRVTAIRDRVASGS